jgi:hypothetical protein
MLLMCKQQGVILVLIKIEQPFSGGKTLKKVAQVGPLLMGAHLKVYA